MLEALHNYNEVTAAMHPGLVPGRDEARVPY